MIFIAEFERLSWGSACYGKRGDIHSDNASCLYNCAVSDRNTRQDENIIANPNIFPDCHGLANIGGVVWERFTKIIMVLRKDFDALAGMKIIANTDCTAPVNADAVEIAVAADFGESGKFARAVYS